jgi:hypothetical protein
VSTNAVTTAPQVGQVVQVRSAFGHYVAKRAVTGVVNGDSFRVVRVCSEEEWVAAQQDGHIPAGTPWPAEDVQVGK